MRSGDGNEILNVGAIESRYLHYSRPVDGTAVADIRRLIAEVRRLRGHVLLLENTEDSRLAFALMERDSARAEVARLRDMIDPT